MGREAFNTQRGEGEVVGKGRRRGGEGQWEGRERAVGGAGREGGEDIRQGATQFHPCSRVYMLSTYVHHSTHAQTDRHTDRQTDRLLHTL